jgi:L-asparaginase
MARVALIFTGGTISMQHDAGAGGALPALDGAAIVERAAGLRDIAEVDVIDWGMVSASHLRFADLLSIHALIERELARPEIGGAVVVQGTDAIEETAFAYDLLLRAHKPVIVTGAMRDASSAEYDGPRNLADAVRCAAAPELAGEGVLVVLAGDILAADDVIKSNTTAIDTFRPRDGAAVGTVSQAGVTVAAPRPARRRSLPVVPAQAVEDVFLVTAAMGMDGALLRALAPLTPRGVVIAATGAGNTHPDLLAAAAELMAAGTIVALTTRCPSGTVAPLYAFPGGGLSWERAGALRSALDGPKTRVALALGLAAGMDRGDLAQLIGP